ncbi:MAG: 2-hydroxyacid dehydrogenase [Azospirillaceae bacterium]
MRVLFRFDLDARLRPLLDRLAQEGIDVTECSEASDEDYLRHLPDAQVLWHVLKPVTGDHIARARNLRLIQKIGVGVNTIDLEAAKNAGVAVCNLPGSNSRAVAELTVSLMLACLRRVAHLDSRMRAGEGWHWPSEWQGQFGEIGGRTVGLVGAGAVPRLLVPILKALGARVLVTARTPRGDLDATYVDKGELLASADIVSLHIPLTEETAGWLDRAAIARMKPGAILVNTARGGLVDETALIDALNAGHLSAAGLDVFADEPIPPASPLRYLETVTMTPHLAWLTRETLERSIEMAAENCRRVASGEKLLNRIV